LGTRLVAAARAEGRARGAAGAWVLTEGDNEPARALYRAAGARIRDKIHPQEAPLVTVDTPTPYRMSDVLAIIDEQMGRLDVQHDLSPLRRLKSRLEALATDPRYGFMFGGLTVDDAMVDVLGRLFRIPVEGKPITTVDLTGVPSEVVNVVVSVLCRTAFDLAVWSEGQTPITLVCEEAHRYAPSNAELGFEPTKRAIARIAKEGRKYGVSLCIVSQRPSELDSTILSQCNTVFALRMSNQNDQDIVQAAISDTASGLLEFLPSLANGEAIAFGEGVMVPTRLRFARLPAEAVPGSRATKISERWRSAAETRDELAKVVSRWRSQRRAVGATSEETAPDGRQAQQTGAGRR
ncbi:MAG: ATP-binding protein, partial [Pseudomonadota bacterium]